MKPCPHCQEINFKHAQECCSCAKPTGFPASDCSSRKAFEDWYEADAMPFETGWFIRDEDGDYLLPAVDNAWDGWQAAIAWKNKEDSHPKD